jgi:hypothetical protein
LTEAAGIAYELNFGGVGFPLGTCRPFHRYHLDGNRTSSVVAIPTVIVDDGLFKPHRYGLSRADAWRVCEGILHTVGELGGIVALSFHPDAYAQVDKLGFFEDLVAALRGRGFTLTTAAGAGVIAASRFPAVVTAP